MTGYRILLTLLLVVGACSPASASGAECAKMDDGALRLACYDALFRASVAKSCARLRQITYLGLRHTPTRPDRSPSRRSENAYPSPLTYASF